MQGLLSRLAGVRTVAAPTPSLSKCQLSPLLSRTLLTPSQAKALPAAAFFSLSRKPLPLSLVLSRDHPFPGARALSMLVGSPLCSRSVNRKLFSALTKHYSSSGPDPEGNRPILPPLELS